MKKIAILTSGFAPVPAVDNGAVEMLTTILIEQNEVGDSFSFDIFTVADRRLDDIKYKNSNIIQISINKYEKEMERIINGIKRRIKIKKLTSIYNSKLKRIIRNRNAVYDYVLFENSMDLINQLPVLKGDCKYILHLHNDLNDTSKTIEMVKSFEENGAIIIPVSNYIRNSLYQKAEIQVPVENILYNCFDYDSINIFDSDVRYEERKKLGYSSDDYVVLFVGRLNEEKGILELAKAFAKIGNNNIKLLICGGTWGSEFVENKFTEKIYLTLNNCINRVQFSGYIPSEMMYKYYNVADVVVIPTIVQEAFGMVALEAALYEKPMIATKSGGMVEVVSEENAIWVKIGNNMDEDLSNKISYAYHHKEEMYLKASAAKKEVLSNEAFKQENYFKKFREIVGRGK